MAEKAAVSRRTARLAEVGLAGDEQEEDPEAQGPSDGADPIGTGEGLPGDDVEVLFEVAVLRELQQKSGEPDDGQERQCEVEKRAGNAGGKAQQQNDGGKRFDDHQRDDHASNPAFVGAMVEGVVLAAGQGKQRVMNDLHEPDDSGQGGGDQGVGDEQIEKVKHELIEREYLNWIVDDRAQRTTGKVAAPSRGPLERGTALEKPTEASDGLEVESRAFWASCRSGIRTGRRRAAGI